jgi:hypothetical protein
MSKDKHEITHKSHKEDFPWGWFIFFILCLFGGGEGIAVFVVVLLFIKFFTKIVRS